MSPLIRKILIGAAAFAAVLVLTVVGFVAFAVQGLPDYEELAKYEPPITTRVHAGDGSLIAEFAREQRVFVPIEAIPDKVKNAFLSAEDKGFYEHSGLDYMGIARATLANVGSLVTGDRMQGASTITQQVAKNMLLTSDRTMMRKVKEAFLAQRIEKAFDKDRILELYLNEIYLGQRAYGVAAAALNYFNQPLDKLTLAQAAYLAALPKGPNNYHPVKRKDRATARRNWVIDRMVENEFATAEEAELAKKEDLAVTDRLSGDEFIVSAHFVEELRRDILKKFETTPLVKDGKPLTSEQSVYDAGLSIRSTLDTRLQVAAAAALRRGLDQFDRRKGWRGPLERVNLEAGVAAQLAKLPQKPAKDGPADWAAIDKGLGERIEKLDPPPAASGWAKAVVLAADAKAVSVALQSVNGGMRRASLEAADVTWAAAGAKGEANKARALRPGAIVFVQELKTGQAGLRQAPEVEGAIMAMDPNTGRVLAMVGGYSFARSEYNRATQARRQPGSSFKPIVYAAALDAGLTPATLVEDAPFSLRQADGTMWSPENYTREFYGPTTLRNGLQASRNLMTIRLAYGMGMDRVFSYATNLGVYRQDTLPKCDSADSCSGFLSFALGSGETTLQDMVRAYATFVNGGKQVQPTLIDRIQDRTGKTVYRHDARPCADCSAPWGQQPPPSLADTRPQILDPITAYQIVSMLEGAVERGTGTVIKTVGKPLAGKTGTTNDYKDAWFVGFSPDLVVGVWVGFDQPKSMGEGETGGRLAAPIFRDFMADALKDTPAAPFRRPPGLRLVRIDAKSGGLPEPESVLIIDEAFRPGTEPGGELAQQPFFQVTVPEGLAPDGMGDLSAVAVSDETVTAPPAPGQTAPPPGVPGAVPVNAPPPPPPKQDESLAGLY